MKNNEQNKIRRQEYILALAFILPYMEVSAVRNIFTYKNDGIYIPASIYIMLTITIVLFIIMKLSLKTNNTNRIDKVITLKLILDLMIFIRGLFVDNFLVFFIQFLWFIIPFYYAVTIMKFIEYFNFKVYNIGKAGLLYFSLYICINFIVNLHQYGFTFAGTTEQSRVISPGGGPVIFGYTIVIMTCYLLNNRHNMSSISNLLGICIFFFGGIITGSRAAIWPMMFLLLLFIIINRKAKTQLISVIIFIIATIVFNPVSLITGLVPRIMNLSGSTRTDTVIGAIKVFYRQSVLPKLFGTGLSTIFPYQLWLSAREDVMNLLTYNTFLYNEQVLLVQPHNSYIYLLLETGIIGLLLFLTIFIYAFKKIKNQDSNNKLYKYLLVLFIVVLNYFDSVLIVQPGSAGLWWLLLFFIISDDKNYDLSEAMLKHKSSNANIYVNIRYEQ